MLYKDYKNIDSPNGTIVYTYKPSLDFSFDEMQAILNREGYEFVAHAALENIPTHNSHETRMSVKVLAIKKNETLPADYLSISNWYDKDPLQFLNKIVHDKILYLLLS